MSVFLFFSLSSAEVRVYPPLLGLLWTGLEPVLQTEGWFWGSGFHFTDRQKLSHLFMFIQLYTVLSYLSRFKQSSSFHSGCPLFQSLRRRKTVVHSQLAVNPQGPHLMVTSFLRGLHKSTSWNCLLEVPSEVLLNYMCVYEDFMSSQVHEKCGLMLGAHVSCHTNQVFCNLVSSL